MDRRAFLKITGKAVGTALSAPAVLAISEPEWKFIPHEVNKTGRWIYTAVNPKKD